MHIPLPGRMAADKPVRFTLDGVAIEARAGDSIASAMIAAGRYVFRQGKDGDARGMFCGMGVCGECQVLVDGLSKRACLEKVREGQVVERQPERRSLPDTPVADSSRRWSEAAPDVLVIGAGPAGLSAAIEAAGSGLDVVVVDERQQPGGQFYKQPSAEFDVDAGGLDGQFRDGAALIASAREAGARLWHGSSAWGAFDGSRIAVSDGRETTLIAPRRFVLAPGAYERPLPVPGWTLAGVMTTGAAQTLLRAYMTTPGQRVLVAGNGPLNFQVARELTAAGSRVVAIAEAAAAPVASPLAFLRMAVSDPSLSWSGLCQIAALRARRVPMYFRHALVALDGDVCVKTATIGRIDADGCLVPGSEHVFEVDGVCMNYGFLPQAELARAIGCKFTFDSDTLTWTPERDADGRTTVPEVFLAGDACGLGGARVAMAEGRLIGRAIVRDLGAADVPEDGSKTRRQRAMLVRYRRFQAALWNMFDAPLLTTQFAGPDTLVCRCENVTLETVQRASSRSCSSLGGVKKATRAGMGRCQGRYCAPVIARLLAEAGFDSVDAEAYLAPRPPFKPATAAELAGAVGVAPIARTY